MGKIFLNHFLCHFPCRHTKIPSCPKMSAPISFLHVRKFFEYFLRRSALYPFHDVRRRYIRGCRYQNMDVVLAHHSSQYLNLISLTRLPDEIPYPLRKFSLQQVIAILGHPNKMIFDLKLCVATVAIFHAENYKPTAS